MKRYGFQVQYQHEKRPILTMNFSPFSRMGVIMIQGFRRANYGQDATVMVIHGVAPLFSFKSCLDDINQLHIISFAQRQSELHQSQYYSEPFC